jgi:hypothetical protein
MQSPQGQLALQRFSNPILLGMVTLIAVTIEVKEAYRLFFNPGIAWRGTLDYLMLLLIPIPALMAIMSRAETKGWTTAGDMSSAIAARIDRRIISLALISYILMMTIRETIH